MQLSGKGVVQNQYFLTERCPSTRSFYILGFIVAYKMHVAIALAVQEITGVSQTPVSSQKGVSTNRKPMGNTSVPKKEVSSDRPGRSNAVK